MNPDPVEVERWNDFLLLLKSELYSIPGNLAAAKGFQEILPGQNDYDTCFRGWWLAAVERRADELLLLTIAENEDHTEAGIKKYQKRLERIARPRFQIGPNSLPIRFEVLRPAGAQTAKTVAPAATTPLAKTGPEADVWMRVKAEIEERIERLPESERPDARVNFRTAIEPVVLTAVEMDGTAPVWKLLSPNAKKTRAVLALLRKIVLPSITKIAGGEVQVMVMDRV